MLDSSALCATIRILFFGFWLFAFNNIPDICVKFHGKRSVHCCFHFNGIQLIWDHIYRFESKFLTGPEEISDWLWMVCVCVCAWSSVRFVFFFSLFGRPINYIIPRINNSDKRNTEAFDNVSIEKNTNLINILHIVDHATAQSSPKPCTYYTMTISRRCKCFFVHTHSYTLNL